MKDHAADQLHVEVAHLHDALGRLAADGEGFHEDVVQRGAPGQALLEFVRLCLEIGVRQRFHLRLERVDLAHGFLVLLGQTLVTAAENLGQE